MSGSPVVTLQHHGSVSTSRTLGKVSGVRCSAILHRLDEEVELDGGLAVSKDISRIQILTCMDINTVSLIKQFNASENR